MTEATSASAVDETAETHGDAGSVAFKGENFKLSADGVSQFALMEFALAVTAGEDADDMQGLASLLRFVLELLDPADHARFRAVCRRHKVTADDLIGLLKGEVEAETDRPTQESDDSSGGPETTPAKSGASFGGKGSPLAGRPDLLIAVEDAVRAA